MRSIQGAVFCSSVRYAFIMACLAMALGASERFLRAEDTDDSETMHAILNRQAEAWNRGDIEAFMGAYWKSPELTFSSGGETTRGWDDTLARYRKRYPDTAAMGKLAFSALETQMLGRDAALTLGRWELKRQEPARGNFSLVWRKVDGTWRIIHDHSSSSKTP
ncbi:MAG: YybH family protein [Planctomycetota bacterium]|jgi:ketosteroid isomerase-like protein